MTASTHRRLARRAFTLLEVMIAVMMISLLMVAVFRFVKSVLQAVALSTELTVEKQQMNGLLNFVQLQLEDLPARQQGVLTGAPHRYNNLPADELEWVCPAGHGVLTSAGGDQYRVTLAIQNIKGGKAGMYEIGLRRRRLEEEEKAYHWLPLLSPATALEIRYYEPRSKAWIDAWKDPVLRPSLVRIRIWRTKDLPPYESIVGLPSARTQTL